jgi:hypothetical protein
MGSIPARLMVVVGGQEHALLIDSSFCSISAPLRGALEQAIDDRRVSIAKNRRSGRYVLYFQSTVNFPS